MTVATEPVTLIDLDFGDAGLVVQQYPDGTYTLDVNGERIVFDAAQFDEVVAAVAQAARTKGEIA